MTEAQDLLLHMRRCLLRWICRASPAKREKFVETSNRVRGEAKTAELMAEAREMYVEMKKRGEL